LCGWTVYLSMPENNRTCTVRLAGRRKPLQDPHYDIPHRHLVARPYRGYRLERKIDLSRG
jgi:hypothetical protein